MSKRCEIRSFEIIYESPDNLFDLPKLCEDLQKKEYGVYKGFLITHKVLKKGTHCHVGIILRDKPRNLKWTDVSKYFEIEGLTVKHSAALKSKSNNFSKKLQTYYNYCVDVDKHPDQTISKPHLHKWAPSSPDDKLTPDKFLQQQILNNKLDLESLDNLITDPDVSLNIRCQALKNYDVYEKMITKLEQILLARDQAKLYKESVQEYRPFQKELTKILDTQNDRNIHNHCDQGKTGKNYWLDRENMRTDTCVIQSAETKRIAYAWNPKKHKRIIIDVPKGKAEYINTSALEKLKNGCIFSTMHRPVLKKSHFKPSIVILTNEMVQPKNYTEDRMTYSTTTTEEYEFTLCPQF